MRHRDIPICYRTLQVLSDLRSVAAKGYSQIAARLKPKQTQTLRHIIFDQKCKFKIRDLETVHRDILLVAAMPEQAFDAFLSATSLLLADRLQQGAGQDDLYWNWDTFQNHYRKAPSPVRAALMNGFRWAHASRRVTLDMPPAHADLVTYDESDLRRLLKNIAKSMPKDVRDEVSTLSEDGTQDVHRRALDNCLSSSCILSEFGGWFPGEVVQKASLDSSHLGFAECLALVLIDAIVTQDKHGCMAQRWEEQAEDFNLLRPEFRTPLIAGMRHLHEMGFDWQPYAAWSAAEITEKAIVVPFAKA